jgi:hypothetical protein
MRANLEALSESKMSAAICLRKPESTGGGDVQGSGIPFITVRIHSNIEVNGVLGQADISTE